MTLLVPIEDVVAGYSKYGRGNSMIRLCPFLIICVFVELLVLVTVGSSLLLRFSGEESVVMMRANSYPAFMILSFQLRSRGKECEA